MTQAVASIRITKDRVWHRLGHTIQQVTQSLRQRGQIMLGKGLAPTNACEIWGLGVDLVQKLRELLWYAVAPSGEHVIDAWLLVRLCSLTLQ